MGKEVGHCPPSLRVKMGAGSRFATSFGDLLLGLIVFEFQKRKKRTTCVYLSTISLTFSRLYFPLFQADDDDDDSAPLMPENLPMTRSAAAKYDVCFRWFGFHSRF